MTLQFTTTDKLTTSIKTLIWGEGKVGKTTLAKTLPVSEDKKLAYINVDPGQLALRDRAFTAISAEDGIWNNQALEDIYSYLRSNAASFEHIFLDGLDDVGRAVLREEMKATKNGMKAYGEMADKVEDWTKRMRDISGPSVVIVTHVDPVQDDTGAVTFFPSFPGKQIKNQLNNWFDLIGAMRMLPDTEGRPARRVIQFSREADTRFMVGDRSGVAKPFEEPDLGALYRRIQDSGIKITEEPKVEPNVLTAWAKSLAEKKIDKDMVKQRSMDLFGSPVHLLTISQFNKLKEEIAA